MTILFHILSFISLSYPTLQRYMVLGPKASLNNHKTVRNSNTEFVPDLLYHSVSIKFLLHIPKFQNSNLEPEATYLGRGLRDFPHCFQESVRSLLRHPFQSLLTSRTV